MNDCTSWFRDAIMKHFESGRFSVEEVTEALQEMLDTLRDPDETTATKEEPPMTQDQLDAIWAKHEARLEDDNFEKIEDDFSEEINQLGGEWMMWDSKLPSEEIAEMFVDMLREHGCVVLKNPIAEGFSEPGYVFFWPVQNSEVNPRRTEQQPVESSAN